MTATVHVGEFARRLADELTKELVLTTHRRMAVVAEIPDSSDDDRGERWAQIVLMSADDQTTPLRKHARDSYPNPTISVCREWRVHQRDRVEFSVNFPKVAGMDFAPYEPKRSAFAVTLSATRPLASIAREVMRKVISPFLPHWTAAKQRADATVTRGNARHEIAVRLADIVGIKTNAEKHIERLRANGTKPDAEAVAALIQDSGNKAEGYFRDYSASIEIGVSHKSDNFHEVAITATGLTEKTAAKILRLIADELGHGAGEEQ